MFRPLTFLLAGCFFFAGLSVALARPIVRLHLSGALLQQHDGRQVQKPIDGLVLKAGDLIRYSIVATNAGDSPALSLIPVGPIPKSTAYVPGSARGNDATLEFSLDGKTWSKKPMLSIQTAHGVVKKPADPVLYKAIRWITKGALAAHKQLVFSYDVRVNGHLAR